MPRLRIALAVLPATLLLASCVSIPQQSAPPVAVPASWDAPVATNGAWPSATWWEDFSSEELSRLVNEAIENNTDLAQAAARVLQAAASARIAGAPLLPSVDLQASASRQASSGSRGDTNSSLGISAGMAYELDFWGRNRDLAESARLQLRASRFDRETVALTITASVANSYFQVLSLRERLVLARLDLSNSERVLKLVETRVSSGAASPLDLAQQTAQVAAQRAGIPPLEQQEREARIALAILLGRPPQGFDVAGDTLGGISVPNTAAGLPSELLARRPDIQSAEAQLAAADADIRAARAAFFPSIDLSLSSGFHSASLGTLFDAANPLYAIGASVLQSVFSAGRLEGQEALAVARRTELLQGYRAAILGALSDVETTLSAARKLSEQEDLQAAAVDAARRALDLSETRYRAGQDDVLSVLTAQRSYYQAEDQQRQIRLGHLQQAVALYRALGGGWQ